MTQERKGQKLDPFLDLVSTNKEEICNNMQNILPLMARTVTDWHNMRPTLLINTDEENFYSRQVKYLKMAAAEGEEFYDAHLSNDPAGALTELCDVLFFFLPDSKIMNI